MVQDVAVINKCSSDVRIPEIHTNFDARKGALPTPERDVVGVLHGLVLNRHAIHFQHEKMNLVHVEGVFFARVILDRPIFDRANLGDDRRRFVLDEESRLLAFDCDEEIDWGIGAQRRL